MGNEVTLYSPPPFSVNCKAFFLKRHFLFSFLSKMSFAQPPTIKVINSIGPFHGSKCVALMSVKKVNRDAKSTKDRICTLTPLGIYFCEKSGSVKRHIKLINIVDIKLQKISKKPNEHKEKATNIAIRLYGEHDLLFRLQDHIWNTESSQDAEKFAGLIQSLAAAVQQKKPEDVPVRWIDEKDDISKSLQLLSPKKRRHPSIQRSSSFASSARRLRDVTTMALLERIAGIGSLSTLRYRFQQWLNAHIHNKQAKTALRSGIPSIGSPGIADTSKDIGTISAPAKADMKQPSDVSMTLTERGPVQEEKTAVKPQTNSNPKHGIISDYQIPAKTGKPTSFAMKQSSDVSMTLTEQRPLDDIRVSVPISPMTPSSWPQSVPRAPYAMGPPTVQSSPPVSLSRKEQRVPESMNPIRPPGLLESRSVHTERPTDQDRIKVRIEPDDACSSTVHYPATPEYWRAMVAHILEGSYGLKEDPLCVVYSSHDPHPVLVNRGYLHRYNQLHCAAHPHVVSIEQGAGPWMFYHHTEYWKSAPTRSGTPGAPMTGEATSPPRYKSLDLTEHSSERRQWAKGEPPSRLALPPRGSPRGDVDLRHLHGRGASGGTVPSSIEYCSTFLDEWTRLQKMLDIL